MKKVIFFTLCVAVSSLICFGGSSAQILYDDFSEDHINTQKWGQGEFVREIDSVTEKLVLKYGTPNYAFYNELTFVDPGSVKSIQADVAVSESVTGNSGYTAVRLAGRWYNDGTPGGGIIGDIWAEISIHGNPSGLSAQWSVARHTDSSGYSLVAVKSGDFTTSMTLGETYTLYIGYDDTVNQFTFRVGTEETKCGPTDLPVRAGNPGQPYKALQAYADTGGSQTQSYIFALFDNVYQNGTLFDNFSTSNIDQTKWKVYEFARGITLGKLRLELRSSSAESSVPYLYNELPFKYPPPIGSIEAKVTPTIYENVEGVETRACILGQFYNDGTLGEAPAGDVCAQICIGGSETSPKASWSLWRYVDSLGSAEGLGSEMFTTPVVVGDTYTLSLTWDGSHFTFGVNSETPTFTPPSTTFNPPKALYKQIVSSMWNIAGNNARFEVLIDDVKVVPSPGSEYKLTLGKTGTGDGTVTSEPAGIDCGSDCEETYPYGQTVTLTAIPDANSTFGGWSGGGCSGTGTCTVTMLEPTTATANFGSPCTYYLSNYLGDPFGVAGGIGGETVYTSNDCKWKVATDVPWISITSATSGTGNGRITFAVSENTEKTDRTGRITVADQILWIKQAAQDIGLHYHLIIDNPSSHLAKVRMTVKNVSTDVFRVQEHSSRCTLGIEVLTLAARDNHGNPLVVDSIPGPVGDSCWGDMWVVHCAGLDEFIIEYTTEPKKDYLYGYPTYVDTDFSVFAGENIFLLPVNDPPSGSLTVSFELPEDWEILTPWIQQEGIYDALSVPANDIYQVFRDCSIGLGRFDKYTRMIGGAEVVAAVFKKWAKNVKDDIAKKWFRIFEYLTGVWGGRVNAPYLAIFHPYYARDGKQIWGGMGETGQAIPVDIEHDGRITPYVLWNKSSEMYVTTWNSYDWGIVDNNCMWFKEGIAGFYALKTAIHTGIFTANQAEQTLRSTYDIWYNNCFSRGKDWPLASQEADQDYLCSAAKTMSVGLLLGKEIYLRTEGRLTLDDFDKLLWEEYGFQHAWLDEQDLIKELAILTGSDFTDFFADYIFGTKPIPINWFFRDDDGDGLSNCIEGLWDTHPGIKTYKITATAGAHGSISPHGSVYVDQGKDGSFSITPDPGYRVADVKVDGVSKGQMTSYMFTNVRGNHRIEASFQVFTGVTLLAPNGGEILDSGAKYDIRWEAPSGAVEFTLSYSMDNGVTWNVITNVITNEATGTRYSWDVPKPIGNRENCLVRLAGFDLEGARVGSDRSDVPFAIEVIKLTSPDGGESWISGSERTITWETHGTKNDVAKVKLYYTKDGENTWVSIGTLDGNPEEHLWTLPRVKSKKDKCKVKVVLMDKKGNSLGSDISDGYFTIEP